MFYGFILDIVKTINEYVAVNYLIIHAIDKKLVKYYKGNYGFSEFELNSSETSRADCGSDFNFFSRTA